MCLLAFAWKASKRFPLILASNRDEYLNRPSLALAQWQTPAGQTIWSGRDARAGGAWIGFSPEGRFAMLTNVRPGNGEAALASAAQPSRGKIVIDWLESRAAFEDWNKLHDWQAFAGFNLIAGDWASGQCHYLSNRSDFDVFSNIKSSKTYAEYAGSAPKIIVHQMQAGCVYGLSNAGLDSPWPKTLALKASLQKALEIAEIPDSSNAAGQALASLLWSALGQSIPDQALAHLSEREQALSCAYVRYPLEQPSYGTVSSLIAYLDAGDQRQPALKLFERSHPLRQETQTALSLRLAESVIQSLA